MNVKLRLLNDDSNDYKLLYRWYHNPDVYNYFEQRILSYEEIVNKYKSRVNLDSKTPVYMILYEDKAIGIIQYTVIDKSIKNAYEINYDGYELDIFIGEDNYYNLGIGKVALELLMNKLGNNNYLMIVEDENIRAIKCYQKVGFRIFKQIKEENTIGIIKDKLVMIYEKRS